MAKAGKTRHSGSTRTPPVINHEPLKNEKAQAEPVALENTVASSDDQKPEQVLPHPEVSETNRTPPPKEGKTTFEPKAAHVVSDTRKKGGKGGALAAGLTGGVVALALAGGLQWAGFLPSPADDKATMALQQQINTLKTDIVAAQNIKVPGEETFKSIANKADAAAQTAADALSQLEATHRDLAVLRTGLNSLGAQNGDGAAISALSAQITGLEDKAALIDSLNQRVAEVQGALEQTRARLNGMEEGLALTKNWAERLNNLEANSQKVHLDLTAFSQQVKSLEDRPVTMTTPDTYTTLIAANALKAAVDRGSSYVTELQNFENINNFDISLNLLKQHANSGLLSAAELSNRFIKIADSIAATESDTADNAGFGDKIWASARRLVINRPVGDAEGTNAGAVAARMEVAIEKGDYDRALSEWQTLPEKAKAVSADFINILTARRDADKLLNQLVGMATQPHVPSANQ